MRKEKKKDIGSETSSIQNCAEMGPHRLFGSVDDRVADSTVHLRLSRLSLGGCDMI